MGGGLFTLSQRITHRGLVGRAFPGQEIPRTGGRPPVPGISSGAGWARPAGPGGGAGTWAAKRGAGPAGGEANAVRMFAVAAWIARRTAGWVTPDAGQPAASGRAQIQSSVPASNTPAPRPAT